MPARHRQLCQARPLTQMRQYPHCAKPSIAELGRSFSSCCMLRRMATAANGGGRLRSNVQHAHVSDVVQGRPAPHPVRVVNLARYDSVRYGKHNAVTGVKLNVARRRLLSAAVRLGQENASGFARFCDGLPLTNLVGQAPVPSQSGSSTPGTTASTSGRAGSTGRVQVAPRVQ